jgi:DNA modification methylase
MGTNAFLNRIICGDNVDIMQQMDADSVDLTITSPPYDNLRTYNGYSFDFENVARELYRVTKPGGAVVWVVADATVNGSETLTSFKQAIFFREIGFNVHDTMIYAKTNPFGSSGKGQLRYRQAFEYMFVFSKGKIATFNPQKEPCVKAGKVEKSSTRKAAQADGLSFDAKREIEVTINQEKVLRNIWEYHTGYMHSAKDKIAFEHPAIFPEKLVNDHIISWSNPSDIVFDPFGGSGTTAKMAKLTGRQYISVDISEEYCELARKRLEAA